MLTAEILSRCMPRAPLAACEAWAPAFDAAAREFGIEGHALAAWLASMANESGQLSKFEEVSYFNTPVERIVFVFGARTPPVELMAEWKTKGRQFFDERLFNWLYDDRRPGNPKLGNIHDGDGYKRRGLGPLQITGGNNQRAVSNATGTDFYANPALLSDPVEGARASAAFFKINGIVKMAADGSQAGFLRAMRAMNPGLKESEFQTHHLARWREVRLGLSGAAKPQPATATQAAKQVATGKTGKALIVAAATGSITAADALTKLDEATTLATASKGFLGIYGLPPHTVEIVLGVVTVLAIGFVAWRYGWKLLRGEAVST